MIVRQGESCWQWNENEVEVECGGLGVGSRLINGQSVGTLMGAVGQLIFFSLIFTALAAVCDSLSHSLSLQLYPYF